MTLQECYAAFEGDYDETLKRLCSPGLVAKLLRKFPDDKSYASMKEALAAGDYDNAFLAAHTIKGVALNLGFGALGRSSVVLTDLLRDRRPCDYAAALADVERDYDAVINAIEQLD